MLKEEPYGVIATPQAEDGWKMADGRWKKRKADLRPEG
jgi:hypothetical protein